MTVFLSWLHSEVKTIHSNFSALNLLLQCHEDMPAFTEAVVPSIEWMFRNELYGEEVRKWKPECGKEKKTRNIFCLELLVTRNQETSANEMQWHEAEGINWKWPIAWSPNIWINKHAKCKLNWQNNVKGKEQGWRTIPR